MKKIIPLVIFATGLAVSANAETTPNYYTLNSGDKFLSAVPADIISNYDGFTGSPAHFEIWTTYTGLSITKDFTFDSGLTWISTAGSSSLNPPTIFIYASKLAKKQPARFSRTAKIKLNRL